MVNKSRVALTFLLAASASICLAAAPYTPGSTVEIREGDLWTKVTAVRTEGRKTLVRYDDGTEEWITADRLRNASAPDAPRDTAKTPPDASNTTQAPDGDYLRIGSQVEYKSGFWNKGKITRTQRGWYLVARDNGRESVWCEPWAIRGVGTAYDIEGWGTRNGAARLGESAPVAAPGPAPKVIGAAPAAPDPNAAPSAGNAPAAAPQVSSIDFSNPVDPQPGENALVTAGPTTRPTREFIAATVRSKDDRMAGLYVCRDTPETAVISYGGQFDKPLQVMLVDTRTGRQVAYHTIGKGYRLASAANGGKVLLTFRDEAFPKMAQLWELQDGAYRLKDTFDIMGNAFPHINFACLIDATHAIYRDSGGDCYLLDLAAKKATGFIKTAPGANVYVSPDGQVLGVITSSKTALLIRTKDFSSIAEFTEAADKGNVVLDPSGECAAFLTGDNLARVVKVADGSTVATFALAAGGDLDMPMPGVLLVDHRLVYDAKTGIPAWVYALPNVMGIQKLQLANGQTMFCSANGTMADVCIATIPDARAQAAVKAASKDAFMLTPGTPVHLSATFEQFGDEAANIGDLVRNSITAAGLQLSDRQEAFEISVTRTQGNTDTREYASGRGPRMGPMGIPFGAEVATMSVPSTIVTVVMSHEGAAVWSQEFRFQAGSHIQLQAGQTMQGAINDASKPTAGGMASLAVPGYLPKGAVPGSPAALGASDLTPRGFVPSAKPQSPPLPGQRQPPAPRPRPNEQAA